MPAQHMCCIINHSLSEGFMDSSFMKRIVNDEVANSKKGNSKNRNAFIVRDLHQ